MSLPLGTRLGPYEILSPLGAGGMGEVYRARDTSLSRDVAIKVLPAEVATNSERLARFRREAQLLAALNHPNIASIYGLDQADGKPFLVLELVEGEDLADRLQHGAIPLDEALPIAKQIAEALEEGHVKVLDFGLAKAYSGDGEGASKVDSSHSPTLTRGTELGVILGTAAYMSPEQARGRPVDKRADIWSFGVVLYEMLTGKRLFLGETVSDTLAAVLTRDPDWAVLPATVPGRVRTLLHDCLVRDPKQRLRDIGEVRRAIERAEGGGAEPAAPQSSGQTWSRALPWALVVLTSAAAALALRTPRRGPAAPGAPLRLSVEIGADASLVFQEAGPAAILSPDGSLLVCVARAKKGERPQLFLRRLDQLRATPLAGTEGAHSPFFSPDGQSLGFFADGQLKRAAVTGGSIVLAEAQGDRGGSWSEDGTIVFTPNYLPGVGLSRVSSSGGAVEVLTKPDPTAGEVTHRWPQVLPGGHDVLFTAHRTLGNYDDATLVVQALPHGARKVILKGGYHGRYLPSGHIVYVHEGTLFAIPFDLARLEAAGAAVPVVEELAAAPVSAGAQFSVSTGGILAYQPGKTADQLLSTQWLDRAGKLSPLRSVPAIYRNPRFSPDGTKLAMQIFDAKGSDIWVYEWGRDTMSRLTFDVFGVAYPVWAPDGRHIVFNSSKGNTLGNLYWQRADGTGEAQRLTESPNLQFAPAWHPSGKYLAFAEMSPETSYDVMILPVEEDGASGLKAGRPTPFLNTRWSEGYPAFSPSGRLLAYTSNETGRVEVYVRPFPGPGGRWEVSTEGGSYPTWSRDGRELFYETPDERLMAVRYTEQDGSFHADKPRLWCETRIPLFRSYDYRSFDVHPDGQRLAVLKETSEPGEATPDKVVLVLNFFDELRRLAPTR